jgi:hypothetical protein
VTTLARLFHHFEISLKMRFCKICFLVVREPRAVHQKFDPTMKILWFRGLDEILPWMKKVISDEPNSEATPPADEDRKLEGMGKDWVSFQWLLAQ